MQLRDIFSLPEVKAERVNAVTAKADMHKIGCALMLLMECMAQAGGEGERASGLTKNGSINYLISLDSSSA